MQRLQYLRSLAETFITAVERLISALVDRNHLSLLNDRASSSGTCARARQIWRSNQICLDFFVTFFIKKKSKWNLSFLTAIMNPFPKLHQEQNNDFYPLSLKSFCPPGVFTAWACAQARPREILDYFFGEGRNMKTRCT
jgi:hypothetical protein